jgi:cold shock protein
MLKQSSIHKLNQSKHKKMFCDYSLGEIDDLKGTLKRWNNSQGYGFIESEEENDQILVHHLDLTDLYDLKEGQIVEFQIDKTSPRPKAIKVKIIKEPNNDT